MVDKKKLAILITTIDRCLLALACAVGALLAPLPAISAQAPAADIPAAPRFEITRFALEGNTLLRQQEIDRALAPYVGKEKDFGDIQRALEALEQAYRDRGYAIVQVLLPEQD